MLKDFKYTETPGQKFLGYAMAFYVPFWPWQETKVICAAQENQGSFCDRTRFWYAGKWYDKKTGMLLPENIRRQLDLKRLKEVKIKKLTQRKLDIKEYFDRNLNLVKIEHTFPK